MHFDTVVCFDDLARDGYWPAKEFFYDLVRAPIHCASGIDIAKSPRMDQRSNLLPGFDARRFLQLATDAPWQALYRRLPAAAADYLRQHVPARALVLGYELTPALRAAFDAGGIAWLDLRLAPLRFGADLYVGLDSNLPQLHEALARHALGADEVLAEACMMAAKVRYRRRYRADNLRLSGTVVYFGQTPDDASLLDADGRTIRVADRADALRAFVGGAALRYQPHPLGGDFAQHERASLCALLGRPVEPCAEDTYELLACDDDVRLVGLSSGVLQEAQWFGKPACLLAEPLCHPVFGERADGAPGHTLVAAHTLLSEPLWADLLGAAARPRPLQLPAVPNRLRELHNTWWGYSRYLLRDNQLHKEMFAGALQPQRQALADCERALDVARAETDALRRELRALTAQVGALTAAAAG